MTPRVGLAIAAVIGLITLIFEIIYRHAAHPHFMWHKMPLFDLIYGAVGCLAIVFVSKWLGHAWLERESTYYGDES